MKLNKHKIIIIDDQALKITYRRAPQKELMSFLGEQANASSLQAAMSSDKDGVDHEKMKELMHLSAVMSEFSADLLPRLIIGVESAHVDEVEDSLGDDVRLIISDLPDDVDITISTLVKKLAELGGGDESADFQPELFELELPGEVKEISWADMDTDERKSCLMTYQDFAAAALEMVMERDGHRMLSKSRRRRSTGGRRKR